MTSSRIPANFRCNYAAQICIDLTGKDTLDIAVRFARQSLKSLFRQILDARTETNAEKKAYPEDCVGKPMSIGIVFFRSQARSMIKQAVQYIWGLLYVTGDDLRLESSNDEAIVLKERYPSSANDQAARITSALY